MCATEYVAALYPNDNSYDSGFIQFQDSRHEVGTREARRIACEYLRENAGSADPEERAYCEQLRIAALYSI